ncbi:hypothetical protein AURDEDRAFT_127997 [Auricularia subglabra TFB-10046 SS5]|nr:hypothetical protein AURDEDRAFT_127997 [Auricularia subglabra TFB-10046 SS5]
MNLAYAIFNNHRGDSAGDGFGREINPLNRHGLSASTKHPNLHTLDEFLLHFWTASTLENWMWATGAGTVDELVVWAKSVTDPQVFVDISERIVRERQSTVGINLLEDAIDEAISTAERETSVSDAEMECNGLDQPPPPSQPGTAVPRTQRAKKHARQELDDERLRARIILNRDLLLLQVQRYAIKHGDVGLLDVLTTPLAIYFKGGGHGNYGNDLLHYLHWRANESTDSLRDLVRHCWLVNTVGHEDSFLPVDEMQEHFNREQREWHARAGANFSLNYLKKISPAIPTLAATIKHMAENFDLPYRSQQHTAPNAEKDIRAMAARFHQRTVSEYTPGRQVRDSANRPADFVAEGTKLLQKPATWNKVFDEHIMYHNQRSQSQYFGDADVQQLARKLQDLNLNKST